MKKVLLAVFGIALGLSVQVQAQDACKNRGDLDTQYCDENKDMVADTPRDPKKLKTPNTIVFTYTPVEDPAVYEKIFWQYWKLHAGPPRPLMANRGDFMSANAGTKCLLKYLIHLLLLIKVGHIAHLL